LKWLNGQEFSDRQFCVGRGINRKMWKIEQEVKVVRPEMSLPMNCGTTWVSFGLFAVAGRRLSLTMQAAE